MGLDVIFSGSLDKDFLMSLYINRLDTMGVLSSRIDTAGVVFIDCPIDIISQLSVHLYCHIIAGSNEEINKESFMILRYSF